MRVGAFVILLALWYAISALGSIKPLFLPSPAALWHAFLCANSDHTVAVLDRSTVFATEDHMTSPEDLRALPEFVQLTNEVREAILQTHATAS